MIEPPDAHVRVLFAADDAARGLAALVASPAWLAGARTFKDDARCSTLAGDSPVGPVVVKTWRGRGLRSALNRLISNTQARRHRRGAALLESLGEPTGEPLLHLAGRRGGSARETLVLRLVEGRSLLRVMADAKTDPRAEFHRRCAIARAVGAQVSRIARAGWLNRDHKPSNLIVSDSPDGPLVAVIDCVGFRRDSLKTGGLRMLTSLLLEPLGTGVAPALTMRMRALRAASGDAPLAARKAAWRSIAIAVEEHGDPTPRVNPLGAG